MRKSQKDRLDQKVLDVVLPVLAELDTARALTVTIMLRHHEYRQLAELKATPDHYDSAERYARSCAATDLLRKYPGLPAGFDTAAAAKRSFFDSEKQCKKTNDRLQCFNVNYYAEDAWQPPEVHMVVDSMREFSRLTLGEMPRDLNLRFGPGATVSDQSRLATVPDKLSSVPTMTSGFNCLMPVWDRTAWARAHYRRQHAKLSTPPVVVRGNVFFTVRKDSTTDRGAAKGPSLNVAYQMSVGREFRSRLAGVGIDLEIGQQKHQKLARESSVHDHLSTIDLSSASDTVSYQFVKLVIPTLWFELLESLREEFTQVDKKWVLLNKYSAMGNGYTFELETLLFLSICYAAAKLHGDDGWNLINSGEISVYGDDIIVPRIYSETVVSLLRFFGFTPNPRKTFLQGNFRESCGGDYFKGSEVTPYRLKDEITEPHQWIGFANGLAALGHRLSKACSTRVDFGRARQRALSNVPVHIRQLTGPTWLGDLVIHESGDERTWLKRLKRSSSDANCLDLTVWAPVRSLVSWQHFTGDVVLASALYGSDGQGVSPRGVQGYKVKRVGRPDFLWSDSLPVKTSMLRVIEGVTGIVPFRKKGDDSPVRKLLVDAY
nr:MAG: RNA dependent RNA polymerase [Leviviridae sp.]